MLSMSSVCVMCLWACLDCYCCLGNSTTDNSHTGSGVL